MLLKSGEQTRTRTTRVGLNGGSAEADHECLLLLRATSSSSAGRGPTIGQPKSSPYFRHPTSWMCFPSHYFEEAIHRTEQQNEPSFDSTPDVSTRSENEQSAVAEGR